jgi:glycosidase
MNKYCAFLISIITLFSCTTKKEISIPKSKIKGLASPVYLNFNETNINLKDYFLDVQKIDSISKNKYYFSKLNKDKDFLIIKTKETTPNILNLRVWFDGEPNDIPLYKNDKTPVEISILDNNKKYNEVKIKGEFSNWQLQDLVYSNKKWTYKTTVSKGNHQYVLVIDGKEQPDPTNKNTISNGMGGVNSILKVETNADKIPNIKAAHLKNNSFTIVSDKPITNIYVYYDNYLFNEFNNQKGKTKFEIKLPKNGKPRSFIRVYASNKFGRTNDILIPLEKGKIITDPSKLKRTDFHTQIMYFLMVDRFVDGNKKNTRKVKNDSIHPKANYYGGDLQGVLNKIKDGYFSNLGINTIWLSPITKNPEGAYGLWKNPLTKFSAYHGYWPISNTKIDDRFGNEETFKELINQAHKNNINVILDYVANHIHKEHPLYKKHPDWATNLYLPDGTMNTEKWDEHRLTTWFDTFLPTLDFSKNEVIEKMTDSATYWVTKYDLDGFRHDATKHIQLKFWRTLTNKIKNRTNRPIFQIGETYGSPELIRSYINTGMLDSQFDFNLYDASVQAFAKDSSNLKNLADALKKSLKYYGNHHLMGNISGNQDRARFISYASGDVQFDEDAKAAGWTREIKLSDTTAYNKLAMLQAFNLFIPGIPSIYYGDEYGAIGANDPDNRRMMRFKLNKLEKHLKNIVKDLIQKRKNSMALQYGSTKILRSDKNILILKRTYFNENAFLIINKSDNVLKFQNNIIPSQGFKIIITK